MPLARCRWCMAAECTDDLHVSESCRHNHPHVPSETPAAYKRRAERAEAERDEALRTVGELGWATWGNESLVHVDVTA